MAKLIIRDLKCCECETVQTNQMVRGFDLPVLHYCPTCGEDTDHADTGANTGGANKRYRFADFSSNPSDYRGQVKFKVGAQVGDENGPDSTFRDTGTPMSDIIMGSEDKQAEKRDRFYHKQDTERGTRPLYFTGD